MTVDSGYYGSQRHLAGLSLFRVLRCAGYNRYVKLAAICLAALCLAGCSKNIDTPEAVKEGVIKDIAKKVDVQAMDVNVDSVSFREKEADAKVSFRPKGGDRLAVHHDELLAGAAGRRVAHQEPQYAGT